MGAAGVGQAQKLCGFIKGFPSRIVDGFPEQGVASEPLHIHEERMATGNQERHKGKGRRVRFQEGCQEVALHMMDREGGNAEGEGESTPEGRSHQQRAHEPRACRVGDAMEILWPAAGLGEHRLEEW